MNTNKKYNKINTKEKREREKEERKKERKRKTAEYCYIVVHVTNAQAIHYELS